MDCKEFREILDIYVDDELSPDALTAARVHLGECASCRRVEKRLLQLRSNLKKAVSHDQPPADLVKAVSEITRPRWRRSRGLAVGSNDIREGADSISWRGRIRLPIPVFAIILLATFALGGLLVVGVRPRAGQVSKSTTPIQSQRGPSSVEADYFSRFDHGGRASLYTAPRQ